jgi:hypothetical protein
MPVEEVRSMCDLHSQVTRDVLVQLAPPPTVEPGHPLDTFQHENSVLKQVIAATRAILAETSDLVPARDAKEIVFRLRQSANDLMDLDKHYQRTSRGATLMLAHPGQSELIDFPPSSRFLKRPRFDSDTETLDSDRHYFLGIYHQEGQCAPLGLCDSP